MSEMRAVAVERRTAIAASDKDPLNFLIGTVWDESLDLQTRLSAAAIAVPYLHPKLSSTTVSASHTVTKVDASELLDRIAARIERLSAPAAIDAETVPAEVPETAG